MTLTFSWMSLAVTLSDVCGSWYFCLIGGLPGTARPLPAALTTRIGTCRFGAVAAMRGRRAIEDAALRRFPRHALDRRRRIDRDRRQIMIGGCNCCRRKHERQNAHATEGMTTKHLKILTPARWPACSTASTARQGRTNREDIARSGNSRRRAGLRVRAGPGAEQLQRERKPNHALGLASGYRERDTRRIDWRGALSHATQRTAAVMRAMSGLIGGTRRRGRGAVTDDSALKRIGSSRARGQAGRNRRQYLHHQGKQNNRKKFPQPPAHDRTVSPTAS